MAVQSITSPQNPRVKNLVKLRDRRHRDRSGRFLIEGYRELKRALENKTTVEELFFSPEWFMGENENALIQAAEAAGAALFEVSRDAFRKCSYRDRPDGLLAMAAQWTTRLDELRLPESPLLLVVESIEKPGNLGTLLRGADAAGVDAMVLCDPVTDIFNPNVVRASTGVLFSMPIAICTPAELSAFLQARRIRVVATTPAAQTLYSDAELTGPIALLMGSEQYGLSREWLEMADEKVRIPMAGHADSLNVAMAAIVTLFEAVRQRGKSLTSR